MSSMQVIMVMALSPLFFMPLLLALSMAFPRLIDCR
jgi:hypothetical protein